MTTTRIDDYQVMYSSNKFVPRVWLKSGDTFIGQLFFNPNGSSLPQDGMAGNQVNLYYHLEDFDNVIKLLRSEKAVYLLFNGSGPGFENGIQTAAEPVGQ
jgi:hypothetical protein